MRKEERKEEMDLTLTKFLDNAFNTIPSDLPLAGDITTLEGIKSSKKNNSVRLTLEELNYFNPITLQGFGEVEAKIAMLHLGGYLATEISHLLNVTFTKIEEVIAIPQLTTLKEKQRQLLDAEFDEMYKTSIDVLRDCMESDNDSIRLNAADKFLKAFGKYNETLNINNATAEDVAALLLKGVG